MEAHLVGDDLDNAIVRIIYERGAQINQVDGGWIPSRPGWLGNQVPLAYLESYLRDLGVMHRIVLYRTTKLPAVWLAEVLGDDDQSLHSSLQSLTSSADVRVRRKTGAVQHYLDSAVVHLQNLAEAYAGLASLVGLMAEGWDVEVVAAQRQFRIAQFAETEAVLTVLRTALDATRYVAWPPGKKGVPRNIGRTLDAIENSGDTKRTAILAPLREFWNTKGNEITTYRDCCVHYAPLRDLPGDSHAGFFFANGLSMTQLYLPSNPEVQSTVAFEFRTTVEALDYCWRSTTAVVRCLEQIVPALVKLDSF